ncbi:hypothetical protein Tco_0885868 [Tanacetum coccineum]
MVSHPDQSQHTPNPPLNEKDSSFEEIMDYLFRIGAENLRKAEHEVPHMCDDKTVDITDYEDSDHEDGELPILSATNEFANVYEEVEENIDISITEEKEEVPIEDVKMDENYDIDHLGTKEALQKSLAKDPFLVALELNDRLSFLLHTIPSSISNEVKRKFTTPHSFLAAIQVEARGEVLGRNLATGKHFKSGLVGYHANYDDDELFIDVARGSRLGAWLRACCLFI